MLSLRRHRCFSTDYVDSVMMSAAGTVCLVILWDTHITLMLWYPVTSRECLFVRSSSMRTMSAINSRASTPRSGTLRSHNDLHFGSGVITSYNMATGSRTLDRSYTGSFDRPTYERYGRSSSCERPGFDRSCPGSFDRHHNDDSDFFYHSPPLRSSLRTFQSAHDAEPDAAESRSAFTKKRNDVETNFRSKSVNFFLV